MTVMEGQVRRHRVAEAANQVSAAERPPAGIQSRHQERQLHRARRPPPATVQGTSTYSIKSSFTSTASETLFGLGQPEHRHAQFQGRHADAAQREHRHRDSDSGVQQRIRSLLG